MKQQGLHLIDRFPELSVLVIGDAMLDVYLQGQSDRLCQEAPVPVVQVTDTVEMAGGAANTAVNVRHLGAEVHFLSVIGEDAEGQRLRHILASQRVIIDSLITHSQRQTISKQRVTAFSHLLLRVDQGTTQPLTGETEQRLIDRLVTLFDRCDAVIVSDYRYGVMTPAVLQVLEDLQTRSPRVLVVDSKHLERYQSMGAIAVKPNYREATRLLGLPPLDAHQGRVEQITTHQNDLLERTGATLVAVTLDVEGALLIERDRPPHRTTTQPAPSTQAAGAGDTYISTLTLALAAGATTQTAAVLAAAATQQVVTQPGTTPCSLKDLRAILEKDSSRSDDLPAPPLVKGHPLDETILSTLTQLQERLTQYRAAHQRIVFTNGCFDILHRGHVTYLQQARALGDVLMVGLNTDESVRQLKGSSRPINPLAERMAVLAALGCVDAVIPFRETTPCDLLRVVRPNVFVKGGDYTRDTLPEAPLVEAMGGVVKILPYVGDRSTTRLIQQIQTLPIHTSGLI